MRIIVGGFEHETNTFAPTKADWSSFSQGGNRPRVCSGTAMLDALKGVNLSAAGFIDAAIGAGHAVVPTTWAAASPSAHVTQDAYERVCAMILKGIEQALPADAIYLDLHGAMVAEHIDDGEGELLRRVRELAGNRIPVIASLDLHANVTSMMLAKADALIAYRTYPHVDMADTGRRAFDFLRMIDDGMSRQAMAFRKVPFLIPICWQSTDIEPAKSLYAYLNKLESATGISSISFTPGFPAADFPDCGPVVWAYGQTQADADRVADDLLHAINAAASRFAGKLYSPDEAVLRAMESAKTATKSTVIADAQDNPGAGGNSDTTGILRALVRNNAQNASLGLIVDPDAAVKACAAGAGRRITMAIGGRSNVPGDAPFEAEFLVESVSDGKFDATGPFYAGVHMDLGPSACLRIGGVRIVLASIKSQLADQSMFRFVGIEPTTEKILVVKSTVHFRADFTPISSEILVCASPGPMPMRTTELPWTRLPLDLLMYPGGPTFGEFSKGRR